MSVGKSGPVTSSPETAPEASEAPPRVLDPAALKAYAHPLRIAILRYLNDHGPATATTLARHLGESTGQTSYHLRQLARHGIVADLPGRGTGRERWWRPASVTIEAGTMLLDEATALAAEAVLGATLQQRAETLAAWIGSVADPATGPWMESVIHQQGTVWLTPDELAEVSEALSDTVTAVARKFRDRQTGPVPDGARRVRIYVDAFPLVEDAPAADAPEADQAAAD